MRKVLKGRKAQKAPGVDGFKSKLEKSKQSVLELLVKLFNGVESALKRREMTVIDERMLARDRNEWRDIDAAPKGVCLTSCRHEGPSQK